MREVVASQRLRQVDSLAFCGSPVTGMTRTQSVVGTNFRYHKKALGISMCMSPPTSALVALSHVYGKQPTMPSPQLGLSGATRELNLLTPSLYLHIIASASSASSASRSFALAHCNLPLQVPTRSYISRPRSELALRFVSHHPHTTPKRNGLMTQRQWSKPAINLLMYPSAPTRELPLIRRSTFS